MAIIPNFTSFRALFAEHGSFTAAAPEPLQFTAPNVISRSAIGANWIADGFAEGQRIQPAGTTSNDQYRTIDTIDGTNKIINTVENTVVTEGPLTSGVVVDGVFIDNGGFERWPVGNVNQPGGPGPFAGLSIPWVPLDPAVGIAITVNANAADAVKGVDEYDWYLSQRTDIGANQYLQLFDNPVSATESRSGTVRFAHNALAVSEFGIAVGTPLTPVQIAKVFNKAHLYVQRRSDKLILFTDLYLYQTEQN